MFAENDKNFLEWLNENKIKKENLDNIDAEIKLPESKPELLMKRPDSLGMTKFEIDRLI